MLLSPQEGTAIQLCLQIYGTFHSLNPLTDANIVIVPKILDHVRLQKTVGNIFTLLFNKNQDNIYLYLLWGWRKTLHDYYKGSWQWFASQHSKGKMRRAFGKWKFLRQKQNHYYLKSCIWVVLFCSWVQGGSYYKLGAGSQFSHFTKRTFGAPTHTHTHTHTDMGQVANF